ncbi:uncharacterized protein I206_105636 [Kwoniella pini CBS 10737]|uniref:Protein EFR3 n=1 Tax=Kwoniella pini CBS 10737 TaxID=1296096 RepID=A0A1B9I3Q0_9TREE|nr:uncharacterized protein I206_03464 [Kwoniella pini CBS 10737]OCF50145.1 hypothetical protein I206_03464 [Kwoniella pini CBS 10737]
MGCIPCTTLQPEVSHLNACYPPSKALSTSGPEYRPLSQDLSKLTYFATNKPSKLAKIGEELEKRIAKESTRSTGGYPKYRASLLISLAILRALLIECKRDIPLFAKSALRSINNALNVKVYQRNEIDLEVIGRASAAFIAFTTFTDGSLIGVEEGITRNYFEILQKFSKMAIFDDVDENIKEKQNQDKEKQNRTRLISLASLNGAILSDGLYSSQIEFNKQLLILLPPILLNFFENLKSENTMDQIINQTGKIELDHTNNPSPYFNDFSVKRPLNDRRAPSLHAHIPGEKGPNNQDVLYANLKSFKSLLQQSKISQATFIIDKIVDFLDKQFNNWEDLDRCNWLAERLIAWITLQYRFVVPTRLIELLVDDQTTSQPKFQSMKQSTILAMVITILNSTISLVGLGVSDLLGNLITLIIRRIKIDERDSLLPALVACVSALGRHIYYADQINDIIEEISIRIAEISPAEKNRSEIIRVLTNCMIGVMVTTDQGDQEADLRINGNENVNGNIPSGSSCTPNDSKGKSKSPAPPSTVSTPHTENPPQKIHHKSSRRNPISPEVWQETIPLLCEANYSVRITYARALLLFIQTELPRLPIANGTKLPNNDAGLYRFLNALNASIYTLLMSNCLGVGMGELPSPEIVLNTSTAPTPLPDTHPAIVPSSSEDKEENGMLDKNNISSERNGSILNKEKGVSFNLISPTSQNQSNGQTPTPSDGGPNGSGTVTPNKKRQPRRASLPLNRLQSNLNVSSFDQVATPNDFSIIFRILIEIYTEILPAQAIFVGIPMLLALDRDSGNDLIRRSNDGRNASWVIERKKAIRELVCYVFRAIGEKWGVFNVQDIAQRSLASLAEPYLIPPFQSYTASSNLELPEQALSFVPINIEGESSSSSKSLIDPEILLDNLSESTSVQKATGRDATSLRKRMGTKWTVEEAIKDSIERYSSARVEPEDHGIHNEIANVLMSMNNGSYQSFGNVNGNSINRPGSRSIDIGDLREALGGKLDDLNVSTSSPPSIISSSYLTQEDQINLSNAIQKSISQKGNSRKLNPNQDVKEVLKDIFKDKRRSSNHSSSGSGLSNSAHRIRTVSTSSGLGKTSINPNGDHSPNTISTELPKSHLNLDSNANGDGDVQINDHDIASTKKVDNLNNQIFELGKTIA